MKFDKKYKVLVVVFIFLNLLYLKFSRDIKYETTQYVKSIEIEKNENADENIQSVRVDNYKANNVFTNMSESSDSREELSIASNQNNSTSVVDDVGKNINNGPLPIPTNKNFMEENDTMNLESDNSVKEASSSFSHVLSFLAILSMVMTIALVIILYSMEADKKSERYFKESITNNEEGYYLIKD